MAWTKALAYLGVIGLGAGLSWLFVGQNMVEKANTIASKVLRSSN